MMEKIRKAKKEIADLKAKLNSVRVPGLSEEANRLLVLYAQGLSDWQDRANKKPWCQNYQEVLQEYGAELSRPGGCSSQTLWWLLFMTQFRGGKDSEKARESCLEFWLLARQAAPKATEELLSETEDNRELLKAIDRVLAEPDAAGEP